jgi:hypothetical protein
MQGSVCPRCGADPGLGPIIEDAGDQKPAAPPWTGRRRREWATAVLCLSLVCFTVALPRSTPWVAGVSRLVFTRADRIIAMSPSSGAVRTVQMPANEGGNHDGELISIAKRLILIRGGHAWLLTSTLGEPTDLGAALAVFAAVQPGTGWISSGRPDGGFEIKRVTVPGGAVLGTVPIPDGMFPVGATSPGPVLAGDGFARQPLEVWDPISRRPVQAFGTSPRGFPSRVASFVAATSDTVIWEGGDCAPNCPLHIVHLRNGNEQVVAPPVDLAYVGEARLSPDGSRLAIPVYGPMLSNGLLNGLETGAVTVIDLRTGQVITTPTYTIIQPQLLVPHVAWSPRGDWLLLYAEGDARVHGYQLGHDRLVVVPRVQAPPPDGTPSTGYRTQSFSVI